MTFPDFEEFFASLNAHRVRFLVVGGYAVGFHARPRATKDVDVLIDRTMPATYGRAAVNFISRSDLIEAKRAAGRPQDLADVAALERARRRAR